jgi:hypothetical protein
VEWGSYGEASSTNKGRDSKENMGAHLVAHIISEYILCYHLLPFDTEFQCLPFR